MTNSNSRQWDQAGFIDIQGRLDGRVAGRVLPLPAEVRLYGPRQGGARPSHIFLAWRETKEGPIRRVPPGPRLLTDFVRLTNASEDGIRRYAERWGVLHLCKHLEPFNTCQKQGPHPPEQVVEGSGRWFLEPLYGWRFWAHQLRAVIDLAAETARSRMAPREWWEPELLGPRPTIAAQAIAAQRAYVARIVRAWLVMADVRPFVDWRSGTVEVTLGGLGLFAALMSQLVSVISRSSGLTFCAGCGEPYTFTWRKRDDRRHYCSKCGRKAADRDAHRTARVKQRARKLKAEGVPFDEIVKKMASDRATVQRWLKNS